MGVHYNVHLSPKDAAKVKRLLRLPRLCLLCGAFPPAYVGIFTPTQPELWGGKPGKVRLLGYTLCARCYAVPDLTLHVEGQLQAGLVGQQN